MSSQNSRNPGFCISLCSAAVRSFASASRSIAALTCGCFHFLQTSAFPSRCFSASLSTNAPTSVLGDSFSTTEVGRTSCERFGACGGLHLTCLCIRLHGTEQLIQIKVISYMK